jgi:hypothetical protein
MGVNCNWLIFNKDLLYFKQGIGDLGVGMKIAFRCRASFSEQRTPLTLLEDGHLPIAAGFGITKPSPGSSRGQIDPSTPLGSRRLGFL